MLREKIDKLGYEYLGRQYLYLNVLIDVFQFVKGSISDFAKEQFKEQLPDQNEVLWPPKDSDNSDYLEY